MALRCTHCGEVVADGAGPPERGPHTPRSLCPECLNPDDLEPQDLSEVREAELPAPGTRCPACGQVDTLRPLRPPEARAYRTCSADGYSRDFCARLVMVRYALQP